MFIELEERSGNTTLVNPLKITHICVGYSVDGPDSRVFFGAKDYVVVTESPARIRALAKTLAKETLADTVQFAKDISADMSLFEDLMGGLMPDDDPTGGLLP